MLSDQAGKFISVQANYNAGAGLIRFLLNRSAPSGRSLKKRKRVAFSGRLRHLPAAAGTACQKRAIALHWPCAPLCVCVHQFTKLSRAESESGRGRRIKSENKEEARILTHTHTHTQYLKNIYIYIKFQKINNVHLNPIGWSEKVRTAQMVGSHRLSQLGI